MARPHLYLYDGKACPYCRRAMDIRDFHRRPTRDHVIPVSRGGTEKVICCNKCNGIKGDMMPDAWEAYMLANPGWWLLTKAERKRRRVASARQYDHPNGKGNVIRRGRQGSPPMGPVVVPPEYIWSTP